MLDAANRWKDYAELIGIASIVASLVFVGIEVRQSSSALQVDQITGYGEMAISVRSLLAEHADVWHKACAGDELTTAESTLAGQLFRACTEFMWVQGISSGVGDLEFTRSLAGRFAANVHRYPGFAALFRSNSDWGRLGEPGRTNLAAASEFTNLVVARIAELREIEPSPSYDVTWCGY